MPLIIRSRSSSLIIKMLPVTILVILMVASCGCKNTKKLTDSSNTMPDKQLNSATRYRQQIRRSSATSEQMNSTFLTSKDIGEILLLSEKGAEEGDPRFELDCPIGDIIECRKNSECPNNLQSELELIKDKVGVGWFKNDEPWITRVNGNHMTMIDKFTYELYQIGSTDAGSYTCLLDYSKVPRNYTKHFKFSRGARFRLNVIQGLPDLKPTITHPPSDQLVKRGSNVTYTCHRPETTSHQTTYWLKSCSLKDTDCIESFNTTFERALRLEDHKLLLPYSNKEFNTDTYTINNVTDELTGYYGCVVYNSRGFDARMAKLELIEQWIAGNIQPIQAQPETKSNDWIWYAAAMIFMIILILISCVTHLLNSSILRDKKPQQQQNISSTNKSDDYNTSVKDTNLRQHLPNLGCPNIYNISKSADGFITGHLQQTTGHLLAQSINSNILDKENPSISSSNSQHSDEASSSWGKSSCSRAVYSHTSNTTATTVPLYDHPPSNATFRLTHAVIQNSFVSNPTYGYMRPETDTSNWTFPRQNLNRLDKIGEGQFGEVWRYIAIHEDGIGDIVAVKQLKHRLGFSDRERDEILAEIEIMKSINNHPNVIQLLHYCVDDGPILLIMEYAEHGKLQTYLRNCRASNSHYGFTPSDRYQPNITSKDLLKFTYHIAKGMEYVAAQGIVHRDLASRNILVSKDKVCKVADFGFARRVNEDCAYERTTTNPVPVKWMAPEALVENKFTSKSDVFSLAILMWEIVTLGATPYEQLSSEGVYKKVTTGGRLDRPAHCSDEFYNLMAQCWLHDPALRPTFKDVACELEKLLLSDNDYIKLDQYPEHAYYNIINKEEKEVVKLGT